MRSKPLVEISIFAEKNALKCVQKLTGPELETPWHTTSMGVARCWLWAPGERRFCPPIMVGVLWELNLFHL